MNTITRIKDAGVDAQDSGGKKGGGLTLEDADGHPSHDARRCSEENPHFSRKERARNGALGRVIILRDSY